MIDPLDRYRFDLTGYLIIKGALSPDEVAAANAELDAIPDMPAGAWHGHIQSHSFEDGNGINLQQIYEAGPTFASFIDHPAWIEHFVEFCGPHGAFDGNHGELFIDEAFASIRGPGESIGMHSGGDSWCKRNAYRFHNGHFMCSQANVLVALNDIGPGDGATMVIPASHKQNMKHPMMSEYVMGSESRSGDGMPECIEVHLNAGDALIFADAICHGSSKRTNPGQRRLFVYRYGPSWGMFRHGYRPSPQLLDRLTERQRKIIWPHAAMERTPQV